MHSLLHNFHRARSNGFFWAAADQVILSLGAIAIILILSNVLDAQTFGKARFLVAILAVFAFFSLPGIGPVILQHMPIYSYRGFRQALVTQAKWGLGATLGAALLAGVFYFQGDTDLAYAFAISGVLAPIANLYLMPGTALAGLHKFSLKTMYDGAMIAGIVVGAWYGATTLGTVTGTMLCYYATQSAVTVLALYFVKTHLTSAEAVAHDMAADTKFGKQLTLFQLPFTLLPALEKVLVFIFLGPTILAVYIIAFLPIEHIRNAYRNLLQFFVLPHLGKTHTIKHWFLVAFLLSAGSIVAVVVFALWLLPLLFPDYPQVQELMLYSALIPLALPAYLYVLQILSERKTERLYAYAIITVLIDTLSFAILISVFGLAGAAAAKIFTAFGAAGTAYVLYRTNGVSGHTQPPPN